MVNKRQEILDAALGCAVYGGLEKLTYQSVAAQCGIRTNSVVWYYPTIKDLKQAVVDHAIVTRNLDVVAQAVVTGYRVPRGIASDAINYIAERYLKDV